MWICLTTATRRRAPNSDWAELDWAELAVGLSWALIGRSGRLDLDRGMFQSASSQHRSRVVEDAV